MFIHISQGWLNYAVIICKPWWLNNNNDKFNSRTYYMQNVVEIRVCSASLSWAKADRGHPIAAASGTLSLLRTILEACIRSQSTQLFFSAHVSRGPNQDFSSAVFISGDSRGKSVFRLIQVVGVQHRTCFLASCLLSPTLASRGFFLGT